MESKGMTKSEQRRADAMADAATLHANRRDNGWGPSWWRDLRAAAEWGEWASHYVNSNCIAWDGYYESLTYANAREAARAAFRACPGLRG